MDVIKHLIYVVTQRELFNHLPFGYTSRINITLDNNKYVVNFLAFHAESGIIAKSEDIHELCERFSNQSSYKFCPELDWDLYE